MGGKTTMARLGADEEDLRGDGGGSEVVWAQATQWISRTLAVALFMVLPGIVGSMLDRRFGTSFFALLGFLLGLVVGTTGLVVLAKRFSPQARGKPLAWEDDDSEEPPSHEPSSDEGPSQDVRSQTAPPKSPGS